MPFGFSPYPSGHPCLPFGVSAACPISSRRLSRQTVLTLRSRPLPPVAGRCAIELRAAPLTYNVRAHVPPLDCLLFIAANPLNHPVRPWHFFAPVPHRNADRVAVLCASPHSPVFVKFSCSAAAERARQKSFQVVRFHVFSSKCALTRRSRRDRRKLPRLRP
jgi:hypothetical protein